MPTRRLCLQGGFDHAQGWNNRGGFFGEKHAQALSSVRGARLVAVSRRNSEALRSFTDRYGIKGFQDYRDLLNDPEIDTVVVATPHYLHTDITLQAANLGKHILLEKPMALTLEDCDAIIEAVNKSEVSLMVGHLNQFARCYQKAKEIIDS
ncbi:MAG TPA: Gfo/Idh/MocA family oxidoreductase, partial [Spirochaetia bacterium]|nr:Gfo/Idh/MocA family oxidoreductase [Spirochaetia bacterium]